MSVVRVRVWSEGIGGSCTTHEVDAGMTLHQIAERVPMRYEALRPYLRASVGGHEVPRAHWPRVRLKAGCETLTLRPTVGRGGGGGGGRKMLATLASLAIAAAAFYVAGPLAAGMTGAKLLAMRAAALGISIAGSLLVQGLLGPKKPDEDRTKQIGFAGGSNDFRPGAPLQRVIGRRRTVPQMVVPPFTTVNGDDQAVTAVYGLAGHHVISDVKIGDVNVASLVDVVFEVRNGVPADAPLTLVPGTYIDDPVGIQFSEWRTDEDAEGDNNVPIKGTPTQAAPYWHRVETKKDVDAFRMFFLFGGGLIYNADEKKKWAGVAIRVRFREVGATTWNNLPDLYYVDKQASKALRPLLVVAWVDLPYPAVAGNEWMVGGNEIGEDGLDVTSGNRGWSGLITDHVPGSETFAASAGTNAFTQWYWEENKLILYLDKAVYPKGRYEFEIKRSWPINFGEDASLPYFVMNALIGNPFEAISDGAGGFEVPANPAAFVDDLSLPTVQSEFAVYPITPDNNPTFLLAVRVRNRQLDRVNVMANGIITGRFTGDSPTRNPADWYYHVLTDPEHNSRPYPESLINMPELQEWADWCDANSFTVDFIAQGESVIEILQKIAQAGYASPRYAAPFGVIIDKERVGPVGMVNQATARNFRTRKPLMRLPHALRVTFDDIASDYRTRETVVFFPGYSRDGTVAGTEAATRYETVRYEGIVNEFKAIERAERDIAWMLYRSEFLTYEQDNQYLEYARGEVILVQTDMLGFVSGGGYVAEVIGTGESGDIETVATIEDVDEIDSLWGGPTSITDLVLDRAPEFGPIEGHIEDVGTIESIVNEGASGLNTSIVGKLDVIPSIEMLTEERGIVVRLRDGTLVTSGIAAVSGNRVTLTTPITAKVRPGDAYSTGPLDSITRQMIVWGTRPRGPGAEVTTIPYAADQIYS